MECAIETDGLGRTFGDFAAVDGIDLRVPSGGFYGFLGPNGAGKSTTIKCLTGLLRPTSGRMRILGLDPLEHPVAVKKQVGVLPEDLALFDRLTGIETLLFAGQVHGLSRSTIQSRGRELLELMDLEGAGGEIVADYSHGMRKKLALATALIAAPRVLFLDEPFEGIDAVASRLIKDLLGTFVQGGGTVFLTSHILEIVENLCDTIGVIQQGRLIAQGPLGDLRSGSDGQSLEEIFLDLVGASQERTQGALEWLK